MAKRVPDQMLSEVPFYLPVNPNKQNPKKENKNKNWQVQAFECYRIDNDLPLRNSTFDSHCLVPKVYPEYIPSMYKVGKHRGDFDLNLFELIRNERTRLYNKQYYYANQTQCIERASKWNRENKDKVAENERKRCNKRKLVL